MVKIGQACSDDASGIGSVHVAVCKSVYAELIPATVLNEQNESILTSFWKRYQDDENWPVYVAKADQKMVGFASRIPCRDTDHVAIQIMSRYRYRER